ncbi:adenylate kinase [Labrenzia sp. VG12]|uniref:adenylate kinase n=1 Tax=Labrenzia sp. VG12 TaxID=2021862 RepID=UPI0018DF8835|nr:adenylate kinase [Labrenzia sp. VG12]
MEQELTAQNMNRVLIAGCPGSGKSQAARALGQLTGLPVIHLDSHYWLPGWQHPTKAAWRATIQELVARPRWIMDGNFADTLDLRLAAADTLIYLDFSTLLCATRVARRTLFGHGKSRGGELPEGCVERIDWPFFRFVLNYREDHREKDLAGIHSFAGKSYIFTRPRQLARFLAGLKKSIGI